MGDTVKSTTAEESPFMDFGYSARKTKFALSFCLAMSMGCTDDDSSNADTTGRAMAGATADGSGGADSEDSPSGGGLGDIVTGGVMAQPAPGGESNSSIFNPGSGTTDPTPVADDDPTGTCSMPRSYNIGDLVRGTTVGRPDSANGASCGGNRSDVVYKFSPERGGRACLSLGGSEYDTVLFVRQGQCESTEPADEVACDDDNREVTGGTQSAVDLELRAGVTYYVVVDGYGAEGAFVLSSTEGTCAENPPPQCLGSADCPAGENCIDGLCGVSCESDAQCTVARTACRNGICQEVDCVNDDECFNGVCIENFCADCRGDGDCSGGQRCSANECVDCLNDADCGDGYCSVGSCVDCRDDNDCADDLVCAEGFCYEQPGSCVTPTPYVVGTVETGNTVAAESNLLAGGECTFTETASPEAVFTFTASEDRTLCFSTAGSGFDTVMYIRTECTVSNNLECNDDNSTVAEGLRSAFQTEVTAGTTYFLVVDGYGSTNDGRFVISSSTGACNQKPPPECDSNDDCIGLNEECLFGQCTVRCETVSDCPGELYVCADEACIEVDCLEEDDCPFFGNTICTGDVNMNGVLDAGDNSCVACQADRDCDGDEFCVYNDCVECRCDADCGDGVCVENGCVECRDHEQCPVGQFCHENSCSECDEDVHCGEGRACVGGNCFAAPGTCDAPVIYELGTLVEGNTGNANAENTPAAGQEGCSDATGRGPEAVFSFVPNASGSVCLSTEGSDYDTVLYVNEGGCDGTAVACNDDNRDVTESNRAAIELTVADGSTEYTVFVDGFSNSSRGIFRLSSTDGPCATNPPAECNDDFPCRDVALCESGECEFVECLSDDDCSSFFRDEFCVQNTCIACRTDSDCDAGVCVEDGDIQRCMDCREDTDCAAGVCELNQCVECRADGDCSEGGFCVENSCAECRDDTSCTAPASCAEGSCFAPPGSCESPKGYTIGTVVEGTTVLGGAVQTYSTSGCAFSPSATKEAIFEVTPDQSGPHCFSTRGSRYDTLMYLRESPCGTGAELGCNDDNRDFTGGLQSAFDATLTAGTTYYLIVDGYGATAAGIFRLSSSVGSCQAQRPPECNDTYGCGPTEICNEDGYCGETPMSMPEPMTGQSGGAQAGGAEAEAGPVIDVCAVGDETTDNAVGGDANAGGAGQLGGQPANGGQAANGGEYMSGGAATAGEESMPGGADADAAGGNESGGADTALAGEDEQSAADLAAGTNSGTEADATQTVDEAATELDGGEDAAAGTEAVTGGSSPETGGAVGGAN